ncbi:MAG: GNAT family N-acetyltransferase, partial [Bacteroidia bacterium]|nr:GNAT family N-acetyltransferase [Bacteroidia bacterium]
MKTEIKSFDELTTKELYDLLQLREEVFIVEQNCPYNDIDGNDEKAYHLLLYKNAVLIGYTRLFSPGIKYNDCSIGRVVIKKEERLKFYGKK